MNILPTAVLNFDVVDEGKGVSDIKTKNLTEKDKKTRRASVIRFGATCEDAGINYSIHHDKSVAIQQKYVPLTG